MTKFHSKSSCGLWLNLFLFLAFFIACSSFTVPLLKTSGFDEGIIWQPWQTSQISANVPRDGTFLGDTPLIEYYAGKMQNPRLEFWALRINLHDPRLGIRVYDKPQSIYVSAFTEEYNCIAGINTIPFSPVSGRQGEARSFTGIVISDGVLVSPPNSSYDALVFYATGEAAIVRQRDIVDTSNIVHAAGGFRIVLENGKLPQRLVSADGQEIPAQNLPRYPRSAVGISADGNYLYLLAVDGRRPGSIGATEAELGLLLKQLGAYNGLNFDGGGSTALALRYPDGKVRTINKPIHNYIPGNERGIAAPLGIYFKSEK